MRSVGHLVTSLEVRSSANHVAPTLVATNRNRAARPNIVQIGQGANVIVDRIIEIRREVLSFAAPSSAATQ
jgi:hypothetical protein